LQKNANLALSTPLSSPPLLSRYRSKLLVVIVAITFLGLLAQKVLSWHPLPCFRGVWYFVPQSKPTDADVAQLQNLAAATDAFEYIYPLLALLGASRWQSAWFLLPALAGALTQFSLLTQIDAQYCFTLAKYGNIQVFMVDDDDAGLIDGFRTANIIIFYRLFLWCAALAASLILSYLVVVHIVLPSLAGRRLMTLAEAEAGVTTTNFVGGDYAQLSSTEAASPHTFKAAATSSGGDGDAGYGHKDNRPFVPDMVIAYKRLRTFERNVSDDATVCAFGIWLWLRFALTPLRHWLAVALTALILALLQVVVTSYFGGTAPDFLTWLSNLFDGFDLSPYMEPIMVAIKCVVAAQTMVSIFGALSILLSLWHVSGDVILLLEAPTYRAVWDTPGRALEAKPFAAEGILPGINAVAGAGAAGADAAGADASDVSQPPQFYRIVAAFGERVLKFFSSGTGTTAASTPSRILDLSRFQFTDAPGYILMYATSLLFVCFIAGLFFTGLGIFFFLPLFRSIMLEYVITLAFSFVFRFVTVRAMRCCCTRGDTLLMPRWWFYVDAGLSFAVSFLFSITLGLTRVAVALLWTLLAASQLSTSTLPPAIAMLDSGFSMYGAMLKLSFAWALDGGSGAPKPGQIAGA
jgi:hypothetical protein